LCSLAGVLKHGTPLAVGPKTSRKTFGLPFFLFLALRASLAGHPASLSVQALPAVAFLTRRSPSYYRISDIKQNLLVSPSHYLFYGQVFSLCEPTAPLVTSFLCRPK